MVRAVGSVSVLSLMNTIPHGGGGNDTWIGRGWL
jgi:hypothetical protein